MTINIEQAVLFGSLHKEGYLWKVVTVSKKNQYLRLRRCSLAPGALRILFHEALKTIFSRNEIFAA